MQKNYVEQIVTDPFGQEQKVQVHVGESPLSWLRARGHLPERQYVASDLLRADWEKAGMGAHVTMRWDPTLIRGGTSVGMDPTTAQLSAKERLDGALRAAGPGLSDILWRVACAGEGLAIAERALGWPARAGKLVLSFALERVADWYRVP